MFKIRYNPKSRRFIVFNVAEKGPWKIVKSFAPKIEAEDFINEPKK